MFNRNNKQSVQGEGTSSQQRLPLSYDYDGDTLQPARKGSSDREDEIEQYRGRSSIQKITDGVRKLSTTIKTQRRAQVQLECDLHHLSVTSMNYSIPFANKRGWLWKCKSKGDRWLRRFFILQGQMVVYFVNETDSKPKGAFLLHSYAQVEYPSEVIKGRAFNLDLDTPERTYYLSAESAEEAYEWGNAFINASGEAHHTLYANRDVNESETNDKLEQMQSEYSRVLVERDMDIQEAVDVEKEKIQQEAKKEITSMKVEVATMREDMVNARDQLYQWQHLAENLLDTVTSQDMFLSADQKEKVDRMTENFSNLSNLLKLMSSPT